MKVGINAGYNSLENFNQLFKEHKIGHIQIGRISPDMMENEMNDIRRKICAFRNKNPDIELSHHAYPFNFAEQPKAVRKVWIDLAINNIKFAQSIGCSFINFHLGYGIDAGRRDTHKLLAEKLIPEIEIMADQCFKHNLGMHVENMYPEQRNSDFCYMGDRLSDFQTLFNAVKCDTLKLCYDYGHGNLDEHGIEILRAFSNRLGSIHAHDNDQISDLHKSVGAGKQNTIDWSREIEFLKEIGFKGVFILENYNYEAQIDSLKFLDAVTK